MTGVSPGLAELGSLFQSELLIRWLPGLIFAVALLVILSRFQPLLVMPGMILGAIGVFYAVLGATNTTLAEVRGQGWLMGPFPAGELWPPFNPLQLFAVDWSILLGQTGHISALLIMSAVALLLNAGGLELIFEHDLDLNRELRAAGLGNLGAGLGGGIAGYHSLALSSLGHTLGASSRLVGFISAGVAGVMLFFGASVLALVPRLVLGGLLMFLGLSLLVEWGYQASTEEGDLSVKQSQQFTWPVGRLSKPSQMDKVQKIGRFL